MKLIFAAMTLMMMAQAHAGLRYNRLIYSCTSSAGNEFQVLKPALDENGNVPQDLKGSLLVYTAESSNWKNFGAWCSSKASTDKKIIKISEKEFFAENPYVCSFELNQDTLKGSIERKTWNGYLAVGKPSQVKKTPLNCEPRDEIVDNL